VGEGAPRPAEHVWTCTLAGEGGHLGLLQWVRKHGCQWDKWTCAAAARGGHLEVLVWAREHGCPWGRAHDSEEGEDSCALAAEGGHLEVLQWAREHSAPWNEQTFAPPLREGSWRCSVGRGSMTARGTMIRAQRRRARVPGSDSTGAGGPRPVG
jgi:hypothetical protein